MTFRAWTGDPGVDAIIAREIRYGQTRWTEVWLSLVMVLFGVVLIWPQPTFVGPQWRVVAAYVSEAQAGHAALAAGLVRLVALWINGRRRETPIARTLGCAAGFLFWMALAAGFALAVPPLSTGLAVYPVLALAELHSSYRAAGDLVAADSFRIRDRNRTHDRAAAAD